MQKLMNFSRRHPAIVIGVLLIAAILSFLNLNKLWIDSSTEAMMILDDPGLEYYRETLEIFGSDMLMIVYVEDERLFTVEKLSRLDGLVDDLHRVPGLHRIESLFSVGNLDGSAGYIDNSPLMEWAPSSQSEADEIRHKAVRNPLLLNNIISPDGEKTAINLYLQPIGPDSTVTKKDITLAVARYVEAYGDDFEVIFEIGQPYTESATTRLILEDMKLLMPIAFLVLLLMLIITTGSLNGAILPLLTSSLSILFTFGFMGFFNLPLNLITFVIPILVIVIGSTEDVHILAKYVDGLSREGERELAIQYMSRAVGTAVLLTALTTFLGFLAISINRVVALRQFGIISGFALFINPLITATLSPVYLSFFGARRIRRQKEGGIPRVLKSIAGKLVILTNRHTWLTFSVLILVAAGIGAFSYRVKVNNDPGSFLPADSPVMSRSNKLHEELSGTQTFFIRLSAETPGAFQRPEYLGLVAEIQEKMRKDYSFDKTSSIADFITLINREMNLGDPAYERIPESGDLISQYALFLYRDEIDSYINSDWDEANILVRHKISASDEINRVLKRLDADIFRILNASEAQRVEAGTVSALAGGSRESGEKLVEPNAEELIEEILAETLEPEAAAGEDGRIDFGFTGEKIAVSKAADSIAISQALGIAALLLSILIIMSVLFTNIKAGLLSLIPNIFPIAIFFGVMGIFNIPLNLGTCMVAAIAIGISVDDTIHFMTQFNEEFPRLKNRQRTVESVLHSEIRPIVATSIALALGFLILSRSRLLPIYYLGILSAVVVLGALLADLMLTPILLSSVQLVSISEIASLRLAADLKHSPLFEGMSMYQIKKLVLLANVVKRQPGEVIVGEGEHYQNMCILLKGRVRVTKIAAAGAGPIFLASLGVGDVFGEIAMLRKSPRSASVTAEEPVSYLELDADDFQRIGRSYKKVARILYYNIAKVLGKRLVDADQRLKRASIER